MGGSALGWDLTLEYDGATVTGRLGGPVMGADVNLTCDPAGLLTGRIGGRFDGKDVNMAVSGFPWLVAGALVAATYYQLHLDKRRE